MIIVVGDDDNHEVDGEQGVIGLPLLLIPIIQSDDDDPELNVFR